LAQPPGALHLAQAQPVQLLAADEEAQGHGGDRRLVLDVRGHLGALLEDLDGVLAHWRALRPLTEARGGPPAPAEHTPLSSRPCRPPRRPSVRTPAGPAPARTSRGGPDRARGAPPAPAGGARARGPGSAPGGAPGGTWPGPGRPARSRRW